ncbi:MAG: hypothetical protein NT166_15230 [Candidatus Aminicenantes bacterium]|nr:hypothetical protein [Candidatus Aminicenantes bacterium]
MFGSNILETAIGLIFVYLAFSLVCSGVREWIAVVLNSRTRTLKKGIVNLLKDKKLAANIFDHHLVQVKSIAGGGGNGPAPKSIPPNVFAEALLDNLLKAEQEGQNDVEKSAMIDEMKASIAKIENYHVRDTLNDILESVGKDKVGLVAKLEKARQDIEKWFDAGMEHVSVWYKRQTHKIILGLAVVFCILFNVDTIMITRALSVNSALRESLTTVAMETAKQPVNSVSPDSLKQGKELQAQIQQLGLPIGWAKTAEGSLDPRGVPDNPWDWLYKVLGLAMSILAVSMGAPFWFDILKKLIDLRSKVKGQETAPAPALASPPSPSAS